MKAQLFFSILVLAGGVIALPGAPVQVVAPRCEYLPNPLGIDETAPRLSWRLESPERGQRQTAFRIVVASTMQQLSRDEGDLWDTGKISSSQSVNQVYAGKDPASYAFWKVRVWDKDDQPSAWRASLWSRGLRSRQSDWSAPPGNLTSSGNHDEWHWISYRDTTPLHTNRNALFLPPPRHYRKTFQTGKPIKSATLLVSALGSVECYLNGQRVGDAFFEPGWSDYRQRVYYRTHDVTPLVRAGTNCLGAIVADGWYSGYVGYGLLVGYGPNKVGRYFYGKTPAFLAQLRVAYEDGSAEQRIVETDTSWQVSADGPLREADLIMGESFDARRDRADWCAPDGAKDWHWEPAILARDNGSTKAVFYDNCGAREVELGFQLPKRLQAYPAPPIRVTQELPAQRITEPKPGTYIFNLGQNLAGIIRLKVKGTAGTRLQIRYGEMLHPDGRLMTENLRKARATDYYTLRGDPADELWSPRFTYHGFQFVELTGLAERPGLDAVTGLVVHSDTPMSSSFACSDEVLTKFWKNGTWTQRANFIELPTDCPQRDERLGWMGDAQAYIRTASYNADVAAFFTKWLDDVEEAQRSFGAYPDYCPYPMGHGSRDKTFGTAWTDAGIICPWTIWWVYGDTRLLEKHWDSMRRFMDWRAASTTPEGLGVSIGNTWGDWLNVGETTPIEFIDTCYHALDCRLMAQMAQALQRPLEADLYRNRFNTVRAAFIKNYVTNNAALTIDSQTAHVLALWVGLLPDQVVPQAAARLADKIARNGHRMTTGFLGTKPILPALTTAGYHDLAVRLFQSRQFPSWGYEVVNGATSVWERWDSFTREHGFEGQSGTQNASMNSFSHYAFGAVCEWAFQSLAGIDTDGPGFQKIILRPGPPAPGSNPDQPPIDWVRAEYHSIHGPIISAWKRGPNDFEYRVSIPANTTATLYLPADDSATIREGGRPLAQAEGVRVLRREAGRTVLTVASGSYNFHSPLAPQTTR
jgi:alpha-L-rhamnosidase